MGKMRNLRHEENIASLMLGRWNQVWMKLLKSVPFVAEHWVLIWSFLFSLWHGRQIVRWESKESKLQFTIWKAWNSSSTPLYNRNKTYGLEILKSRFLAIILTWSWRHFAIFSTHYDVKTCSLLRLPSTTVRSQRLTDLLLLLRCCPPIYSSSFHWLLGFFQKLRSSVYWILSPK